MTQIKAKTARKRPIGVRLVLLLALSWLAVAAPVVAGPSPSTRVPASPPPPKPTAAPVSSATPSDGVPATVAENAENDAVAELQRKALRLIALKRGELDVDIEPQSLFSVPLDNAKAIEVETRRLSAIVASSSPRPVTSASAAAPARSSASTKKQSASAKVSASAKPSASASASASAPVAAPAETQVPNDDDLRWRAQLAVDRATLLFLSLTESERSELLKLHQKRQLDAGEATKNLLDAEKKKDQAKLDLKRAEEATNLSATEAERRIAQERTRLLTIREKAATYTHDLLIRKQAIQERTEQRLKWLRDITALIAAHQAGGGSAEDSDATYDLLVASLGDTTELMSKSLEAPTVDLATDIDLAKNPLAEFPADATREVETLRANVVREALELRTLAHEVSQDERAAYTKDLQALNGHRLAILDTLSAAKRDELFGFGLPGRRQATMELDQVTVTLKYHATAITHWAREFRPRRFFDSNRWAKSWAIARLLGAFILFVWWYRRADGFFSDWASREEETARRRRLQTTRRLRAARFVKRIHRPLSFLLLFIILRQLLPESIAELVEVELVGVVLWWVLGEAVVVDAIDAIFSRQTKFRSEKEAETAALRLKSLRLVGRVVVFFGLTLSLTRMLVGEATVYHWLTRARWIAVMPLVLVLIRRHRENVFERFRKRGSDNPLAAWVLEHQTGWLSLIAAGAGAIFLAWKWVRRVVRTYLGGFHLTRRFLAYWFRREVSKKESSPGTAEVLRTLGPEAQEALDPAKVAGKLVPHIADQAVEEVITRIEATGGGLYTMVGERGRGKTTALKRIAKRTTSTIVTAPFGGVDPFLRVLKTAVGLAEDADFEQLRETLKARNEDTGILIDDAHHLIRPVIGGLEAFETILELAREASHNASTWVFALDGVIWQFFRRARGSRPVFDEVFELDRWSEEGISTLLRDRSNEAELEPNFGRLVTDLHEGADAFDHAESLEQAEANYYRLLWDYSNGNPAIALHFWRESLGVDEQNVHRVNLFAPPNTKDIEQLPDAAIFVLRAVIQLEQATVVDIVSATMLPPHQVEDALRYSLRRGYIGLNNGRYAVGWSWYRAVANFLERKHLMAAI